MCVNGAAVAALPEEAQKQPCWICHKQGRKWRDSGNDRITVVIGNTIIVLLDGEETTLKKIYVVGIGPGACDYR